MDQHTAEIAEKYASANASIHFSTELVQCEENNLEKMAIIKNLEDSVSQYFSEEEFSVITEKNVSVNASISPLICQKMKMT